MSDEGRAVDDDLRAFPKDYATGEMLIGPFSLAEALQFSEPSGGGTRVAVSSPDAQIVAIQLPDQSIICRRLCKMSGRGGSRYESGEWIGTIAELPISWRPG